LTQLKYFWKYHHVCIGYIVGTEFLSHCHLSHQLICGKHLETVPDNIVISPQLVLTITDEVSCGAALGHFVAALERRCPCQTLTVVVTRLTIYTSRFLYWPDDNEESVFKTLFLLTT